MNVVLAQWEQFRDALLAGDWHTLSSYGLTALVALVVIGIPIGIVMTFTRSGGGLLTLEQRTKLKQEIVFELRRRLSPVSAAEMARHLAVDVFSTATLLEQLERERLIESYTTSQRLTYWRLRGVPLAATAVNPASAITPTG